MLAVEGDTDLGEPQVIADCHAKTPWGTVTADQLQRSTGKGWALYLGHICSCHERPTLVPGAVCLLSNSMGPFCTSTSNRCTCSSMH